MTALLLLGNVLGIGCDGAGSSAKEAKSGGGGSKPKGGRALDEVPVYGYEVVNTFPHDPTAFTQGLVFHDGALIESTGLAGRSTLRRVDLQTGRVLLTTKVPPAFWAEGMTVFGGKIYQLTWENGKGFVYDRTTLEKTGEFAYDGEGWGLTHDGQFLILSDGSNEIRFLDPNTFEVKRTIMVSHRSGPLKQINELEYIQGEIYANVWHQDQVARINPQDGSVTGWIDLSGLLKPGETSDREAVLNGIAYDEAGGRVFITGKLWPKLFEIKLKQK